MKKELFFALTLSFIPFLAQAGCEVDNLDGDDSTTSECTSSDIDLLSNPVDLQASSGVLLNAEEGTVNGSFSSSDSGDAVGVSSCHNSGSAAFYGHTNGGSINKNGTFDVSNCTQGSFTYSDATS